MITRLTALAGFFFLVTSCVDEEYIGMVHKEQKTVPVTFFVDMGTVDPLITRSIDEVMENRITTLDILVFRQDTEHPYDEYFTDRIKVTSPIADGSTVKEKTFTVPLGVRSYKQRFVLIANADDKLAGLNPSGQLKTDVLSTLIHTQPGKWDTASIPIPMWGESETVIISTATTSFPGIIKLNRMLARIDVRLATNEAKNNFKLKKVLLYNRKTRGHVVPHPDNWIATGNKVSHATLPSNNDIDNPLTIKTPLEYATMTIPDEAIESVIYTFEAQAVQTAAEATCLVVGGIYAGDTALSYYRVDFLDKEPEPDVRRDILRNYKYIINITNIFSSGQPTPDEAFNSTPVNMEVEITDWSDSYSDITFDGQHYLKVSENPIQLPADAFTGHTLTLTTNYPGGWTASIDPADNWITLQPGSTSGTPYQHTNLLFNVTTNEHTSFNRQGRIQIKAGNLTKIISVNQSNTTKFSLTVMQGNKPIDALFFKSQDPAAQIIQVSWIPATANCDVKIFHTKNGGVSLQHPLSNPVNGNHFSIWVNDISQNEIDTNPFVEKETLITYTLTDHMGRKQAQSLVLTQTNHTFITIETAKHPLDGKVKSFAISTNLPWKATVTQDTEGIIASLDASGTASTTLRNFYFTLFDDISQAPRIGNAIATITFSSADPDPNKKFTTDPVVHIEGFSGYKFTYNNQHYLFALNDVSTSQVSWDIANNTCNSSPGWFLPTISHLIYGVDSNNPPGDFDMQSSYWTSTEGGGGHYYVLFPSYQSGLGYLGDYLVTSKARCIYGPLP